VIEPSSTHDPRRVRFVQAVIDGIRRSRGVEPDGLDRAPHARRSTA
jgi:hypothetical protein